MQARLTVGLNMGWIYTHCIWAFQYVHMIKIVGPERKAFRVHRPILWGLGHLHTNSQIWLQIFTFSRQFTIPFALAQIICETHISFIHNNMCVCMHHTTSRKYTRHPLVMQLFSVQSIEGKQSTTIGTTAGGHAVMLPCWFWHWRLYCTLSQPLQSNLALVGAVPCFSCQKDKHKF